MAEKRDGITGTADREILQTRVIDAPRELVFRAWTDPEQVTKWWGPRGFRTTTYSIDVKPGGVWRFVMHGPDGVDYQNKITYLEVVAPERIVYKHGGDKDCEPVNFETTVTFEAEGDKTRITMRALFPSAAALEFVVEKYGAIEGAKQHIERLAEHAEQLEGAAADRPFVITRVFDAPRDLVFKAWTERERLMEWFGPKGFTTSAATLDLRPGGTFHFCMRSPDGKEMWGKFAYREIIPPERIVWVHSFSDEQGNLTRHPFSEEWPLEMLATATFVDQNGRTAVTVQWAPMNASDAERAAFDAERGGMTMGWTGTFDQLAAYLSKA